MSERKRLIELLKQNCHCQDEDCSNCSRNGICFTHSEADYLLENGIIVLPCDKVYSIVDKNTKYAYTHSKRIGELSIDEIRDLSHYGYYSTKEEAEKALKGGAE